MSPITFDRNTYLIDGRPVYLNSGELHYFRVPREDWRARMRHLKSCGGNCLATYIPWILHEPEEGVFDFGESDPQLDVDAFLRIARQEGLYVIARPGPYQYSELRHAGIAKWLAKKYPQTVARKIDGSAMPDIALSYLHPTFLAKTQAWFDAACPILVRHTLSRGGAIAFVQPDNELAGVQVWHGGLDYHPETMGFGREDGRFARFLRSRYERISAVNAAHGTRFETFAEAHPRHAAARGPEALRARRDYFDFYCATLGEYLAELLRMLDSAGFDVPYVHNSANLSMNAFFLESIPATGGRVLIGSDHYYNLTQGWGQNNPTPQWAVGVFCSLETLRLMGFPPSVFELPSGSLSDWPPPTPQDAEACYFTNLALGMKGHNYYIFSGGPNPRDSSTNGDDYDYGAPIGAQGEIRPTFAAHRAVGAFLAERPWFPAATRQVDVRVGLEWRVVRSPEYREPEDACPETGPTIWEFARRGVLTTAFCAGYSPGFVNLDDDSWTADTSTPLFVTAASYMPAATQRRLVRFAESGGAILVAPALPTLEEHLHPCALLAEALGAGVTQPIDRERTRATIAGVANVPLGKIYAGPMPDGSEPIGVDETTGSPVAWRKRLGLGTVTLLGCRWHYGRFEQRNLWRNLLSGVGASPIFELSNPNVWASLVGDARRAVVFLLSLYSAPMTTTVRVRPPWGGSVIDLGEQELGAMEVRRIDLIRGEVTAS